MRYFGIFARSHIAMLLDVFQNLLVCIQKHFLKQFVLLLKVWTIGSPETTCPMFSVLIPVLFIDEHIHRLSQLFTLPIIVHIDSIGLAGLLL